MLSNKFFQAVGVVLVIISFAMVGYAVHVVATNSANMHQPQLTTVIAPHTVQILFGDGKEGLNNRFFLPSSIVIPQGDTVKWINDDTVSHTVTAAQFNSGLIWPQGSTYGLSSYSHKFDTSGRYSYFCQLHPYMNGVVLTSVNKK
ncbi:MAG TPA: plastocyanin/azurin family copper-binding protein [Candidatus Bathyarchaeia archaeon]|nr:plastocyanin/azurin family copper-binding protein [Candidatus Bathyarchaeia archaeon]